MSKLTLSAQLAAANTTIDALNERIKALECKLSEAEAAALPKLPTPTRVYADLDYAAAMCGADIPGIKFVRKSVGSKPTTTRFTKADGSIWEKTKTGFNQFTSKCVTPAEVAHA